MDITKYHPGPRTSSLSAAAASCGQGCLVWLPSGDEGIDDAATDRVGRAIRMAGLKRRLRIVFDT
jgi:hypothetical protein